MSKPKIHMSCAFIYRNGKILAVRSLNGQGEEAPWELPAGKVETGETPETALRRAISENLGTKAQVIWPYDTVENEYPDFRLVQDCFVCTLARAEEPHTVAYDELRWVSRGELVDLSWSQVHSYLVRSLGVYWDDTFESEHL